MTAINWRSVQVRLGKQYPGKIDGIEGPLSWIGVVDFAAPSQPNGSDAITLRGRQLAASAEDFGLVTAERVAGYLSNVTHETGDFTRLRENLYYTSASRIRQTWPSRFPTDASATPYVRNPIALANLVYARPKEGNTRPGDGWLFRGGGDIQTTFANGYRAAGEDLDLPLYEHPEMIETPAVACLTGLSYWRRNRLNRFYDAGTPKRGRALLNTGNPDYASPIGWGDVLARYNRLMELLA